MLTWIVYVTSVFYTFCSFHFPIHLKNLCSFYYLVNCYKHSFLWAFLWVWFRNPQNAAKNALCRTGRADLDIVITETEWWAAFYPQQAGSLPLYLAAPPHPSLDRFSPLTVLHSQSLWRFLMNASCYSNESYFLWTEPCCLHAEWKGGGAALSRPILLLWRAGLFKWPMMVLRMHYCIGNGVADMLINEALEWQMPGSDTGLDWLSHPS